MRDMKVTNRNERGKNAKHNGRTFNVSNSDHIDASKSNLNEYYVYDKIFYQRPYKDFYYDEKTKTFIYKEETYIGKSNGRILNQDDNNFDLEAIERKIYKVLYGKYQEAQNERYIRDGHRSRCKSPDGIYDSKKTGPDESIFQIGNAEDHITKKQLMEIWDRYVDAFHFRYSNVRILTASLHVDEATPHIHYTKAYIAPDGSPNMTKALVAMGYDVDAPINEKGNKEYNLKNNPKKEWTKDMQALARSIVREYVREKNLDINILEPEEHEIPQKHLPHRDYKRQQDRIIAEKEQIAKEMDERIQGLKLQVSSLTYYVDAVTEKANELAEKKVEDMIRGINLNVALVKRAFQFFDIDEKQCEAALRRAKDEQIWKFKDNLRYTDRDER